MFRLVLKATQKGKNNNKGFSLVELLVAIVLLAIVVTPMFNAFISSARINHNARQMMVATDLAQNIIEGLSEKKYDTIKTAVDSSELYNLEQTSAFTTMNGGAYNLSSNWVKLTGNATIDNSFLYVTPKLVTFSSFGASYANTTQDLISENSITESMNQIFEREIAGSINGQQVYYCVIDSTDAEYSDEGIIYLIYTNIIDPNKQIDGTPDADDYAYHAIVSIIPTASDLESKNYYFTYNVKVTLYSTDNFDAASDAPFGSPVITVLGGIPSK